jgi:hypothetical protein
MSAEYRGTPPSVHRSHGPSTVATVALKAVAVRLVSPAVGVEVPPTGAGLIAMV